MYDVFNLSCHSFFISIKLRQYVWLVYSLEYLGWPDILNCDVVHGQKRTDRAILSIVSPI